MSNPSQFDSCYYAIVSTPGGDCGLLWQGGLEAKPQLLRVYPACGNPKLLLKTLRNEYPTAQLFAGELPPWIQRAREFLAAYYAGDKSNSTQAEPDWHWLKQFLFWRGQTVFSRRVLTATFQIKRGTTISYGDLARKINHPGAARAVGGALARNPWPVLIPCHRVIGSDGAMTGFSGYGKIAAKKRMLALEQRALFIKGAC